MNLLELLDYFEPPISIGFNTAPEKALEAFYDKGLKKTFSYADMSAAEHASAFTIAKMMDADLLADVKESLELALETGTPFKQWADTIMPTLEAKGWWGKQLFVDAATGNAMEGQLGSPWRLETIFRTNMQSAYAVGEWEQIKSQEEIAPYLMYDAIDDLRTRPEHAAMDGMIHPVSSEFWKHYHPPNGWNCRCSVIQLSQEELDELGVQASPTEKIKYYDWTNPRTGKPEKIALGTDPGFDFNPGEARLKHLQQLAAEKAAAMPPDAARAMQAGLRATQQDAAAVLQTSAQAVQGSAGLSTGSNAIERAAYFRIQKALAEKTPYLAKAIKQVQETKVGKDMTSSELLAVAKEKAAKFEASAALSQYKQSVLAGKTPTMKAQQAFDALPDEASSAIAEQLETQLAAIAANKAAETEILAMVANPNSLAAKALVKIELEGKSKVQVLEEIKGLVQTAKLKQVGGQTLAGFKKYTITGKVPTPAQQAAFESLPAAEKAKLLSEIDQAKGAALAQQPAGAGLPPPEFSTENLVQIGPKKGSNPGGLFQDTTTGTQWYIKMPATADHARNEVLAAKLYELAGVEVPDLRLIVHEGKPAVASRVLQGLAQGTPAELAKAGDGFVVDAWLGNWDVVGQAYDNLLLRNGVPVRIDTGGALHYRAQGGLKGSSFGNQVTELDSLRDPLKNPQSAAVFGNLTDVQLDAGAARVLALSDDAIRALVKTFGPVDPAQQLKLADQLIARKADLAKRFPRAMPVSAAARAQAVEAAAFAAKEGLASVDGAVLTAIKGIASRAAKGVALESKDIERVADAFKSLQTWMAEHGSVLAAKGMQDVQAYYGPWLQNLSEAVARGAGNPARWTAGKFDGFSGRVEIDPTRVKVSPAAAGVTFNQASAKQVIAKALGSSAANLEVPRGAGWEALKAVPLEHQRAISAYTGSYYRAVNAALRAGSASPDVQRYAELLNEALSIAPKYTGTITRGISLSGKELEKFLADHRGAMLDGSTIQHRGFISSSKGDSAAFGGNVTLHIHSRLGVNVRPISLHPSENEVLLRHGARFTVQKVEQSGGMWHVYLEEVDG